MTVCVRRHSIKIPYGVVQIEDDNLCVDEIVEKPDHEFLVNAGIYMLEPDVIDFIPKGKFFDMVQLMNAVMASGKKVSAFPILEYWKDIGQHDQFTEARMDQMNKKKFHYSFTVPTDLVVAEAVS